MQFVLTGFRQDAGTRVFAFEGIATDRTRSNFSVSADLELSRRHGIRMQELPLLCLRFLEKQDEAEPQRHVAFAEADMRLHKDNCEAERDAAKKKRGPPRAPVTAGVRTPWVSPEPRPLG